jgi:hypothetical protein
MRRRPAHYLHLKKLDNGVDCALHDDTVLVLPAFPSACVGIA